MKEKRRLVFLKASVVHIKRVRFMDAKSLDDILRAKRSDWKKEKKRKQE
jgi:hypothetical protein